MGNTSSIERRKNPQTVAKQVIGKVVYDKTNEAIINELANLIEYLENKNYTITEISEWLPHFAGCTFAEMVMIEKEVYAQLASRIRQSDCTFLQTYRIYVAMKVLESGKHIPVSNPKVKFCSRYYKADTLLCLSESLKTIALIDTVFAAHKS